MFHKRLIVFMLFLSLIVILSSCNSYETNHNNLQETYISNKHEFKISYPENWSISTPIERFENINKAKEKNLHWFSITNYQQDGLGKGGKLKKSDIKITAFVFNNLNTSYEQWMNKKDTHFDESTPQKISTINIGEKEAKKILWKAENRTEYSVYFLDGNRGVIFRAVPYNSSHINKFFEIVKSLRFTDERINQNSTSG